MKKIFLLFAVCYSMFLSVNGQWMAQNSGLTITLQSVCFLNKDTGFVAGGSGTILKTMDGGANWTALTTGSTQFLSAIHFVNISTGYAVGMNGEIMKTSDGGNNWSNQPSGVGNHLNSVWFTHSDTGYVGGTSGVILKTVNGGASWNFQLSGTMQDIQAIRFVNNKTGFAVGANGTILKTSDGGLNWFAKTSGVATTLKSISFTDSLICYVAGASGKILKTVNGGSAWVQKASGTTTDLNSINFADANRGYACGTFGKIIRTSNAGTNWTPLSSKTDFPLFSIAFVTNDTGYVVGFDGIIKKTTNGGLTPATVVKQPQSQARRFGKNVTFKVKASGTAPLTFQWKLNGIAVPSATDSILTLTNIQYANEGFYTCEVSNVLRTDTSNAAELMIIQSAELPGDTILLTEINASGNIQWQVSTDTINWVDIVNATTNPYFYISTPAVSGRRYYRAKITDPNCLLATPFFGNIIRNRVFNNYSEIPVGANFHGGTVFFVDGLGNGLISSPKDQSVNVQWGCEGLSIPDNSDSNGATNSLNIVMACPSRPIAASICDSLTLNGYGDWYLPAINQMDLIFSQKDLLGGLLNSDYWSSTEVNETVGWGMWMDMGWHTTADKSSMRAVRAIRSFFATDGYAHTLATDTSAQPRSVEITIQPIDKVACNGTITFLYLDDNEIHDPNIPTTYSYQWKKNNVNIPGATSSSFAIPNAQESSEGYYKCNVTNICGTILSDSANLKVVTITADAGLGGSYLTICGSQSAQIEAEISTNYPDVSTLNFTWSPDSALSNPLILNPLSNPSIGTFYTLRVTDQNGCSATSVVGVFPTMLSADAGANKTIICGDSAFLDGVTSNLNVAGAFYQWSPSIGLNNNTLSNLVASPPMSTKYTVTVSTPYGCSATDTVWVYVNPVTTNIYPIQPITCGSSASLNLNVNNFFSPAVNYQYQWTPSVGLDSVNVLRPTANPIVPTIYSVTVSTLGGCLAKDSILVNVNPFDVVCPPITFTCGDSVLLMPTNSYVGTDTLFYQWSPSIGLSDSVGIITWATVPQSSNYSVQITSAMGCQAIGYQMLNLVPKDTVQICLVTVDSNNKNMVIWEKPISAKIDVVKIYRETGITNQYMLVGSVPSDSLSLFVDLTSFPEAQSNKYKISVVDSCGLESALSDYHKTMHLAINQGMGSTWNLIWEAYEGFVPASYNIYRGTHPDTMQYIGNTTAGSTQYTDLNPPAGYLYYKVAVVKPTPCNTSKSYSQSISNTASNDPNGIGSSMEMRMNVSLYPNPAQNEVFVLIENFSSSLSCNIYDVTGRLIQSDLLASKLTKISIKDLRPGLYLCKIFENNKLVKLDKLMVK